MVSRNSKPTPKNIPKGMKHNPFFQLPYNVINAALGYKLNGTVLRILLFAMKADRGNRMQKLHLGITGVATGTGCGRALVVKGLDTLVEYGFLVEINKRGDYRLGPLFDEFIPDENVSNDVVAGAQTPDSDEPETSLYADSMFAIWNELHDEEHRELDLDHKARERAEMWAEKRTNADADPVADFRLAAEFFMERGHEIPLEDEKERNPIAYSFLGFMKICDMFFKQAIAVRRKDAAPEPTGSPSVDKPAPSPVPGDDHDDDSAHADNSDIPEKYRSFITGKDAEGKFIYREGAIASVEELALVYEHALEKVGSSTNMHSKAAMDKCAEDFAGLLNGTDATRVVRMIGYAKSISKNESQQEYFSTHSFNYHTGRSLFGDALSAIRASDAYQAEMIAKEKREIESGERRSEYMRSIEIALGNYARSLVEDYDWLAEHWQKRSEEEMSNGLEGLNRDYGDDRTNIPDHVISGFRCLATFGILDVPDYFQDAVGPGPWEPTFDWISDVNVKKSLIEKTISVGRFDEIGKKDGSGGQFDAREYTFPQDQEGISRLLKGEDFVPASQKPIMPQPYPLNPYMNNSHLLPDDEEQSFD